MAGRKTGVPTNTIMRATTSKQKADQNKRYAANRKAARKNRRLANSLYGALTYKCSNPECFNKIKVHEELGEKHIQCKCNKGFFNILINDQRKNLAKPDDYSTKKNGKRKH